METRTIVFTVRVEIKAGDEPDWRMKVREARNEIRKVIIGKALKIVKVDSKEEK